MGTRTLPPRPARGAGIGPLIGDHLTRDVQSLMWRSLGVTFLVAGASYVALSGAPNLPPAAVAVACARLRARNVWVVSTTLLQSHVVDPFRRRIFALDSRLHMFAAPASNYLIGLGLDNWHLTVRQLAAALGLALIIPGVLWVLVPAAQARKVSRRLVGPPRR